MTVTNFTTAPPQVEARSGELHIWLIDVDDPAHCVANCAALLSADERQRGQRFVFERDQRRFVVTRACLRSILARYACVPPGELAFAYNHFGKPRLEAAAGDLSFNLSHSGNLAVCAVTRSRDIGVDIEQIRDMRTEDIAERFFTAAEQQALSRLSEAQRLQGFFNCWTRKEAWLKAVGRGIGMGLDQVEVTVAPDEPAEFRRVGPAAEQAKAWYLLSFTPALNYAGAAAWTGAPLQVHFWRW